MGGGQHGRHRIERKARHVIVLNDHRGHGKVPDGLHSLRQRRLLKRRCQRERLAKGCHIGGHEGNGAADADREHAPSRGRPPALRSRALAAVTERLVRRVHALGRLPAGRLAVRRIGGGNDNLGQVAGFWLCRLVLRGAPGQRSQVLLRPVPVRDVGGADSRAVAGWGARRQTLRRGGSGSRTSTLSARVPDRRSCGFRRLTSSCRPHECHGGGANLMLVRRRRARKRRGARQCSRCRSNICRWRWNVRPRRQQRVVLRRRQRCHPRELAGNVLQVLMVRLVHLVTVLGAVAGENPGSVVLMVRWHPRGRRLHWHRAVTPEPHAGRHARVHLVMNHPAIVHHERAGHGHTAG